MNDAPANPPGREIVRLDDVAKERLRRELLVNKADNRIPDDIWLKLQSCGEEAVAHLHRILTSPGFEKRKIHEQIRVIELALQRAYGAPEGSFKRPPAIQQAPEDEAKRMQGDAIKRLANQARFPEMTSHRIKSPQEGN